MTPKTQTIQYTKQSKQWFLLAIAAITIAGLYSLPPVILRGSAFAETLPVDEIFASALVIHVNLSVLIWMLAITALLWATLIKPTVRIFFSGCFYASVAGMVLMVIASWLGYDQAIKNNYIPTINHPAFFMGLGLFGSGIFFAGLTTMLFNKKNTNSFLPLNIYSTAIITIVAMGCFTLAIQFLDTSQSLYDIYEQIHWGGGHVLQFVYTATLMLVWCLLMQHNNKDMSLINHPLVAIIFFAHLALTLPTPAFYFITDSIYETHHLFTQHMRYAGGIAPTLLAILLIKHYLQNAKTRPNLVNQTAIFASLLLFGLGGMLGFMIQGTNVTIPAHYHGSIVGITVAFMGFSYHLLPHFGYTPIKPKWAATQLILYTIGQTAHVSGLALMGGYGALRKAPGTIDQVETTIGKILFFSGGSLAILGGLIFVLLMFYSILKKSK